MWDKSDCTPRNNIKASCHKIAKMKDGSCFLVSLHTIFIISSDHASTLRGVVLSSEKAWKFQRAQWVISHWMKWSPLEVRRVTKPPIFTECHGHHTTIPTHPIAASVQPGPITSNLNMIYKVNWPITSSRLRLAERWSAGCYLNLLRVTWCPYNI